MRDVAFAKRLNGACDGHPHIPAYGQGRQTWIKENLGVSHEAVRKWFTGDSRPRPEKMRALAKALEVDEAWLALGLAPDLTPAEQKVRNAENEGAVNVVTGLLQMNGSRCAFPSDNDPNASFVDIYSIQRGVQLAIHITLAKIKSPNQLVFVIPKEYENCRVIGVIHARANRVHLLNMTHDMIEKYKQRKGGYFEVHVTYRDGAYYSGEDKWVKIESFAKDL